MTAFVAAAVLFAGLSLRPPAHPNDPKGQDKTPPYLGPGSVGVRLDPDSKNQILMFSASNVSLLSWLSPTELGVMVGGPNETYSSDIWGYASPGGREYALIGLRHQGVGFVDITDPLNPDFMGVVNSPSSIWRDMKTYRETAYLVADQTGIGMQIVDLRFIDEGSIALHAASVEMGLATAHNIALNEESGFAYPVGANIFNGGLVAFDLADPLNPRFAGAWPDLYVHDTQVVTYREGPYAGREIAFAFCEENGVKIVDVTDKANMTLLGTGIYPNVSYCHQGWLSEDRRFLYVDDELDEKTQKVATTTTYVFNVEDLTDPKYLTSFTSGRTSIDHNAYVRGRFIYEANYTSGLRVFDLLDPMNVIEVGFFDTRPEEDVIEFRGAWGVYAGLPSGVVLVSDMQRGLFVLDASAVRAMDTAVGWQHYR